MVSESRSRISVPDDTTDSEVEASSKIRPSFSITAPTGYSSSNDSDEDAASTSVVRRSAKVRVAQQAHLRRKQDEWLKRRQLQATWQRKLISFERSFHGLELEEQEHIHRTSEEFKKLQNDIAQADVLLRSQQLQSSHAMLDSLKKLHMQQANEGDVRIKQKEMELAQKAAEEQRKQEAARQLLLKQQGEAHKKQQEEEAKKKTESDAAEAKKAADQAAALAAAASIAARPASPAALPPQPTATTQQPLGPQLVQVHVAASPAALEDEAGFARVLSECQASAQALQDDPAIDKQALREIKKKVTLYVQQISATQEQVNKKIHNILGLLANCNDVQRTYAQLLLADRLVSQCEAQVIRLNSFAFPLAMVAVAVSVYHASFTQLFIAKLQKHCIALVPKYMTSKQQDKEMYLKLGYREKDSKAGDGGLNLESTDEYTERMAGYVMLYAAYIQVDHQQHPHGLGHGWTYLARLLNNLPVNRLSAAALDAFLKMAGYRMNATFKGQFHKMLHYIQENFLDALGHSADPDVRAVNTRIGSYIRMQLFNRVPEGRELTMQDFSSYDRA